MIKERTYLAHRSVDHQEQTVLEHLTGTADLCAGFASAFGAEEQGRLVGLAHDLGKYSDAFQRRLEGSSEQVDHSTAGAWECAQRRQIFAAFAAAGHHGGLPDGGGQGDSPDQPTFCGRMNRAAQGKLAPYGAWTEELSLPSPEMPAIEPRQSEGMFFTRMLYSCLVDADYLDTEGFMEHGRVERGSSLTMEELRRKLLDESNVAQWRTTYAPGSLNGLRSDILRACIVAGNDDPAPLRTLTVPTGGGKTIASLSYALTHAAQFGKQRVIYVIPYTSIIEQTADEFRRRLGDEAVLEHHSGVDCTVPEEETDPNVLRKALATENWDAPIVVTTAVQFFESLFANRSSQCRKLHNIANSVVIFDEAQMLPLPYLRPCVWAISHLVRHYRVSAVLCTATQPALDGLFRQFDPALAPTEIVPDASALVPLFRRVTYRKLGRLDTDSLARRLNKHDQVLCIVNTRKEAQAIFQRLEPEGAFHLSTLMYPNHRKAVLKEIRERLKNGLPCRVASTSLIEAGVDVDFPAVFREEAGLDSILQAAGRCNREGKRPAEESVVYVFQSDQPIPSIFKTSRDTYIGVADYYEDITDPQAVTAYFRAWRKYIGDQGQDSKDIMAAMKRGIEGRAWPFRSIAQEFHLIEDHTQTVYIPADQTARSLIGQLRSGLRSRSLFRKLGPYSVNIYPDHFKVLLRGGHIEPLDTGEGKPMAVLRTIDDYNVQIGLDLQVEEIEYIV